MSNDWLIPDSEVIGLRYGNLVVVKHSHNSDRPGTNGKSRWFECRCDCGNTNTVELPYLRANRVLSCGHRCPLIKSGTLTHGSARKGSLTAEFRAWKGMLARCTNPNLQYWNRYGGRGISICEEWRASFSAFFSYIGLKPTPAHSIDRIDNDGNYEPGNVRWATTKQQNLNTSRARMVSIGGEILPVAEAAERAGVNVTTLRRRIASGWPEERLFDKPRGRNGHSAI